MKAEKIIKPANGYLMLLLTLTLFIEVLYFPFNKGIQSI